MLKRTEGVSLTHNEHEEEEEELQKGQDQGLLLQVKFQDGNRVMTLERLVLSHRDAFVTVILIRKTWFALLARKSFKRRPRHACDTRDRKR